MPRDVIMPALGMAQDTGLIVAWHKKPGDPVEIGDVLFEVETDKATMEVEAQGAGYLTDVTAEAGADVPVGNVIARISETAESTAETAAEAPAPAPESAPAEDAPEDLPEGKGIIMPTLGMAQDTGLLVGWHKGPGDAVAVDDILFEVETDKSTVEVNAGSDGYVAALLGEAGDDIPVGQVIAIISTSAPANPIARGAMTKPAPAKAAPTAKAPPAPAKTPAKTPANAPASPNLTPGTNARILASPKLRRLARQQGLDLARLVQAGHPQPYHVRDLDVLKSLKTPSPAASPATASPCRLTADLTEDGLDAFADWAADSAKLTDPAALLAGLCTASLGHEAVIAVHSLRGSATYAASARLGTTTPSDDAPDLRLRDLRHTPVSTVQVGASDTPVLTLTRRGAGLTVTLEYAPGQMDADQAISLLSNFAGRIEQPLRHLL